MFNKQKKQFLTIQKEIYKRLSELELEAKNSSNRKRITALMDKVHHLKPTNSLKVIEISEEVLKYVKELHKEMINPVPLIIENYADKIDSLLNEIRVEE